MKTLNLTGIGSSDIKYEISKFPDGQQQITITHFERTQLIEEVEIFSRLSNWMDLELIYCATAALREYKVEKIHLYVPYVLGARSDRKFSKGSSNYLKSVICPIINSLNFSGITVMDPHSDCLEMGLNNFNKISNAGLVKTVIRRIYGGESINNDNYFLMSPDAGALKKIYTLSEEIGYEGGIIKGDKHRDFNGKILKTGISYPLNFGGEDLSKDIIIVDDICDGGYTFIELAKALRQAGHSSDNFVLIVTHGIFSKGFRELSKHFSTIYTTNSCGTIQKYPEEELDVWVRGNTQFPIPKDLLQIISIFD